jgi:hydroxypyruvate isomerase
MAAPKASYAWWAFEGRGTVAETLLRESAAMGYDGVEMAEPELWPQIREVGLGVATHRGHGWLEDGLNNPANHDRIEREIRENITLAQQWGCPTLICFSGNRHGASDEEGIAVTAAGLTRVARVAEEAGVTLAVELLNSRVDHPGYQCDHTSWGVQMIEQVNSPAVKLLYDVYHMQIMEGDVIRTITSKHQHFAHYHVAGNPGRHEPDASQELNYPPIYQAIADTGFTGYVGMEFVPFGEPVVALRDALKTLRNTTSS